MQLITYSNKRLSPFWWGVWKSVWKFLIFLEYTVFWKFPHIVGISQKNMSLDILFLFIEMIRTILKEGIVWRKSVQLVILWWKTELDS